MANNSDYQIEGIPDLRQKVQSTDYPYCSVGLISGKKGVHFFHGTGTLIGNNVVLTCAHICYEEKNEMKMNNMVFTPAADGFFGSSYTVKEVHYPHEYNEDKEEESAKYDYAILKLDEDVGD